MNCAHIDFETRSKVDLKKCGAYRYAEDESTKVLCLSWKYHNSPNVFTWFFKTPHRNKKELQKLFYFVKKGGIIKGHNIEFEFAVWNLCLMKQLTELGI